MNEAEAKTGAVVRLCQDTAGGAGKAGPCARYVWFGSGVVHWVTKHIIRPVDHFVHSVEKFGGELIENLHGKCYPQDLNLGGQCIGKGPLPEEPPPAF